VAPLWLLACARSRGNTRPAGHRCRNHSCDPVLTLYDRRRWRRGNSGSRHSGPGADRQDAILLLHNTCDAYALSWKIHDQSFSVLGMDERQGEAPFPVRACSPTRKTGPQPASRSGPGSTTVRSSPCPACPPTRSEMSWRLPTTCSSRRCAERGTRSSCGWWSVSARWEWIGRGQSAAQRCLATDLRGQRRVPLPLGSKYRLPVRPQEIVTLRFRTADSAPQVAALTSFEHCFPRRSASTCVLQKIQADRTSARTAEMRTPSRAACYRDQVKKWCEALSSRCGRQSRYGSRSSASVCFSCSLEEIRP